MKRTLFFLFSTFILLTGVFGAAHVADASGSYRPPMVPTPQASLDSAQNQLTVTVGGQSGHFIYLGANCPPEGFTGPSVTGPYFMHHGSMSVGSVSASVSSGEIVQTSPGIQGTVCDDSGTAGSYSVTKTLNVSSLVNGTYPVSVTMCTTSGSSVCRTGSTSITINRPATPPPLTGSCSASPSSTNTGQVVTWSATRSGGTGSYAYLWSGTDSLFGNTQNVNKTYSSAGTKNASVVITSGNQSITRNCSASVQGTPPPEQEYSLSVSRAGTGSGTVTGPGINCGSDCGEFDISEGEAIPLLATADTGSTFAGWSGACTGTSPTCTVTMDANKSVTATFNTAPPPPTPGVGTVRVRSQGLTMTWSLTGPDGTVNQTTRTAGPVTYNSKPTGTYTLIPTNYVGYAYTISPSSSAVLSANQTLEFIVTYSQQQYDLTATVAGTGSGSVNSVPTGISCGAGTPNDCAQSYAENTSVTLTASPSSGSTFAGWSGACSGSSSTCTVSMNASKSATATFNPATCSGDVNIVSNVPTTWTLSGASPQTQGKPTATQSYTDLSCGSYTLTPAALSGYATPNPAVAPAASQTLSSGGTLSYTLTYTPLPPEGPMVDIKANGSDAPAPIVIGTQAVLSWETANVEPGSCTASASPASAGWSGSKAESGSQSSAVLNAQTIFTLTCRRAEEFLPISDDVMVSVRPAQCNDGIDNDGDDQIDGDDPGCGGGDDDDDDDDDNEGNTWPQCSDTIDNDGDGKIDAADPGCIVDGVYDPNDNDESNAGSGVIIGACGDGFDNDGDGTIDADDPGCDSGDGTEQSEPDIREI